MGFNPQSLYFEVEKYLCDATRAPESVYFAVDEKTDDFVKIGRSSKPFRRAKELNANVVLLWGCHSGWSSHVEKHMHDRYKKHRASGEWFHARPVWEDLRWAIGGGVGSGDPTLRLFVLEHPLWYPDDPICDFPYGLVPARDDVGDMEWDASHLLLHPDNLEYV